jgi:hypothetical protein
MKKETPIQKLKIIGLYALFIILAIVFVIFILVFFTGLYLSLFDPKYNTNIAASIISLLFIVGILAIIWKILSKISQKIDEYLPRGIELTKETIKPVLYAFIGILSTILLYFALSSYFDLFPTTISAPLLIEILKVIIQTNGFLIGLSGIVFAQMFWAIHNQMCSIQTQILGKEETKQTENLQVYLMKLDRKRTIMIFYMFGVIAFFVISILVSLSGMAQTETNQSLQSNPNLTIPFLFMTFGIVFFIIFISQSKMPIIRKGA